MQNNIFIHHVYFWLKNHDSVTDRAKLIDELDKLSKVSTIRFAHIGVPANTDRTVVEKGYAVSWLCFFDNIADEETYQNHPFHLEFIEACSSLWERVLVYDSIGPER